MSTGILGSQADHFIEGRECIVNLAITAIMADHIHIFGQRRSYILLSAWDGIQRGGDFVLGRFYLFHLTQNGLHLVIVTSTSIGFGDFDCDLHVRLLLFLMFLAVTFRP